MPMVAHDAGGSLSAIPCAAPYHTPQLRRLLEQERVSSSVAYRKRKDHFIFTVESTGVLPPEALLETALRILEEKATGLADKL
jgi:DNA-directed RNA polymerase I and III subunit RPAC1